MSSNIYIFLMNQVERFKHNGEKSPIKLIRAFSYYKYLILSAFANWLVTHVSVDGLSLGNKSDGEVIVASLTSFPKRIYQVRYAILSILLQTVRPDRVILWLASEQFPDKEIPANLMDLVNLGLEVRFCDDLRSHKKYFYALQEQKKHEVVITFDDDIIYHPRTIERLMQKHKHFPKSIICNQVHVMSFDRTGELKAYSQWGKYIKGMSNPNKDFMPLTGSGCLYPYNIMPPITYQKDLLKECAFTADDLWIGFIARLFGVPICVSDRPAKVFSVITSSQTQHLGQINCLENGNDRTIKSLISVFGGLH